MVNKTKIVIDPSRNKQKVIKVKGGNGKNLLTSETYKSDTAVKKALTAIKKTVKNPIVVDNTKKTAKKNSKK